MGKTNSSSQLQIQLFGSPAIYIDQELVTGFVSSKATALIYYLAATQRTHSRDSLATLFWADVSNASAKKNLRDVLSNLRKLLGPYLDISRQTAAVSIPVKAVDSAHFSNLLDLEGTSPEDDRIANLKKAVALYQGEFLEGFYVADAPLFEEWVVSEREHLGQQALQALNDLVTNIIQQNNFQLGIEYAKRSLLLSPLQEEMHRNLMYLLALNGQRTQALAQYDTCCQVLEDELGIPPSEEINQLYDQILSGEIKATSVLTVPSEPYSSLQKHGVQKQDLDRDWGDAPVDQFFLGRQKESAQLTEWIADGGSKIIAVLGIGGQGKTSLAAQVARSVEKQFDMVIWRTLVNAPPLSGLLQTWLNFLTKHTLPQLPESLDEQLTLLMQLLTNQRCLLILDNVESIMDEKERVGHYREGYEAYGQLIRRLGEGSHQSCLMMTSREEPGEIARLMRQSQAIHTLQLAGLAQDEGMEMLGQLGITSSPKEQASLIERFSGNPLALLLVIDTIQDFFNGNIHAFLGDDSLIRESIVFGDIRELLDQQFGRLSTLQRDILVWLAIERVPISFNEIAENLLYFDSHRALIEAVRALQQRSLVDKRGDGFTLQNVITEYTTDRLIEGICQELENGHFTTENLYQSYLNRYALLKMRSAEYIRQSQLRLILNPVAERLTKRWGSDLLEQKFSHLLDALRGDGSRIAGYAGGNFLNLMTQLMLDVGAHDFSGVSIWQADFCRQSFHNLNLAGADISDANFAESFSAVMAVTYSPDGKLLAAASNTGAIQFWRVLDNQPVGLVHSETYFISTLVYSSDGQILISAAEAGDVHIWDIKISSTDIGIPEEIHLELRTHIRLPNNVKTVALHPEGDLLAIATGADIWLWDIEGEAKITELSTYKDTVNSLIFYPTDKLLISASYDQTICFWDLARVLPSDSQTELTIEQSDDLGVLDKTRNSALPHSPSDGFSPFAAIKTELSPRVLTLTKDGQTLISAHTDGKILLWRLQDLHDVDIDSSEPSLPLIALEPHLTLDDHKEQVTVIAMSPNGDLLASAGADKSIHLWNIQTGQVVDRFYGHVGEIYALAFHPDGKMLVSSSSDTTSRLWHIESGNLLHTFTGFARPAIMSIGREVVGNKIVVGCGSGNVQLWDLKSETCLHHYEEHSSYAFSVALSPDGNTIAIASLDSTVTLWDVASGQLIRRVIQYRREATGVCYLPDGKRFVSTDASGSIHLWDVNTPNAIMSLHEVEEGGIWAIDISPNGQILALGRADGVVSIWDIAQESCLCSFEIHQSLVTSVKFSPTGSYLATASNDQRIHLLDTKNWETLWSGQAHENWVTTVAFSPSEKRLASAGFGQDLFVWDVASGKVITQFKATDAGRHTLAFGEDDNTLIYSDDRELVLRDVASEKQLGALKIAGPYEGMNISGVTGLTAAQRATLKDLGAVE